VNILVDTLPETVVVGETSHRINTDFKTCLRAVLALEAGDLAWDEKAAIVLELMYGDKVPLDFSEALQQALIFLNGGKSDSDEASGPRVYSLSTDAGLIFAAFRQTHGIDLERERMHWWKFITLFMDLGADTTFCNLINLRRRVRSGQATKEERQVASELGNLMMVPEVDTRTVEEREAEAAFTAALRGS